MKIRTANESDRESLQKFFKHYENKSLIANRIDCYLKHNTTIIADDCGKIAGVLQWYPKEDPKAGVAEFEEIFVVKEYRGKGIASKLVEFAINSVKSFFVINKVKPRKIFLFVNKDNTPAKNLYEKHGFKFIAEVNDLFADGENECFYCFSFQTSAY